MAVQFSEIDPRCLMRCLCGSIKLLFVFLHMAPFVTFADVDCLCHHRQLIAKASYHDFNFGFGFISHCNVAMNVF